MSLEGLIEHIRAIGEEEVSAIQRETERAVEEILSQARADAERARAKRLEGVASKAKRERAQALNQAQIEALLIQDQARQELIDKTLERTRRSLARIREDEGYSAVLITLVRESLDELRSSLKRGDKVLLRADKRDQAQVENALRDLDQKVEAYFDLDVWGGVIVTTHDQRIRIDNTMEARLLGLGPSLKRTLAKKYAG